jgi:hypothetical protein
MTAGNFLQISTLNLYYEGEGKVFPVLFLLPRHKGFLREWRYISTYSLTSAVDEGE